MRLPTRLFGAIGLLSLALGSVEPAHAIVVPAGSSVIANYSFLAPVSGPFHVAHYDTDAFVTPSSQFTFNLQIFDSGNNLLGSRTITVPSSSLTGETAPGTGLGFPVPTSDKQGHVVITGMNQTADFVIFDFSFYNNFGCCSTELLDLVPAFQIVPFIAPLPDYWNNGDLAPGPVPEPGSLAILLGALGLFGFTRRKRAARPGRAIR